MLWWFQANASGMAFYDADTQAAAQSALGRALATFHTPNDDPSINSYADANFLRTRLYNYVAAIQSYVLSQCPSAVFELLWPMDVNDPDNCKLLRYINLPSQWKARAGSGFDTFLIEGYQYPGINHNLDQANRCAQYPLTELAWDQAHCRYLMGLYYGTWPWLREFVNVNRLGLPPSSSGPTTILPVRMAGTAAHERRPLVHLLIFAGWSHFSRALGAIAPSISRRKIWRRPALASTVRRWRSCPGDQRTGTSQMHTRRSRFRPPRAIGR